MTKLTKLTNADGETVGYFSDYGVEMAARQEWNNHYGNSLDFATQSLHCRSHEVAITPDPIGNIEPDDSDRMDYFQHFADTTGTEAGIKAAAWLRRGAISVEVQRFLINKYRRPGMSARDSDLGGPVDAAGVLYILKIKAPK